MTNPSPLTPTWTPTSRQFMASWRRAITTLMTRTTLPTPSGSRPKGSPANSVDSTSSQGAISKRMSLSIKEKRMIGWDNLTSLSWVLKDQQLSVLCIQIRTCNICEKQFKGRYYYQHQRLHRPETWRFKCDTCGEKFLTKYENLIPNNVWMSS